MTVYSTPAFNFGIVIYANFMIPSLSRRRRNRKIGATNLIMTMYKRLRPIVLPFFSTSSMTAEGFKIQPISMQVARATTGIRQLLLM